MSVGVWMVYLSHFEFPHREREYDFTMGQKRTCYDTVYLFLVLSGYQRGDRPEEELLEEYQKAKYARFQMHSPFLLSMKGQRYLRPG